MFGLKIETHNSKNIVFGTFHENLGDLTILRIVQKTKMISKLETFESIEQWRLRSLHILQLLVPC